MTLTITTEELAAAMIIIEEGPGKTNQQGLYVPFPDSTGIATIGIGHTSGVTMDSPPATQEQVNAWFSEDQAPLFKLVAGLPTLEAAAWVDFGFNCGIGSMAACMKAGASHVLNYIHDAKGNIEPGLVTRRQREYFLILLSRQIQKG